MNDPFRLRAIPTRSCHAVVTLLAAALLSTGCVSRKYQAASAMSGRPQPMNAQLEGAPLQTRLDAVIVYHGPGSWKKSAYWDEFLVTFTNDSSQPVTLISAALIDYSGAVMPAGADPWKLEKASQLQRDRYLRSGVNFALNTLGYVAFTYGAAGTGVVVGAALTTTWSGAFAGATVGLAAVPATAIIIHLNNRKHRRAIEAEFQRRRIELPLTLGPGESRRGSLFFPMTVSPQSLRLVRDTPSEPETFLLPLPMLAGMHRKAPAPLR